LSKTDYVIISGKLSWVFTDKLDEFGNWKATIHPNAEGVSKIMELQKLGLKNVLSKDDDGYKITFRRPQNKKIKGEIRGFAPPEVMDKDGKAFKDLIGNGSDGHIKLEVYGYKPPVGSPAKAARLLAIRVDNLVPYGKESYTDEQTEALSGLAEQKPLF